MGYPGGAKPARNQTDEELRTRLAEINEDLAKRKMGLSSRYNLLHDKHMIESELKRRER